MKKITNQAKNHQKRKATIEIIEQRPARLEPADFKTKLLIFDELAAGIDTVRILLKQIEPLSEFQQSFHDFMDIIESEQIEGIPIDDLYHYGFIVLNLTLLQNFFDSLSQFVHICGDPECCRQSLEISKTSFKYYRDRWL